MYEFKKTACPLCAYRASGAPVVNATCEMCDKRPAFEAFAREMHAKILAFTGDFGNGEDETQVLALLRELFADSHGI